MLLHRFPPSLNLLNLKYLPNRVTLNAALLEKGYLVLADIYYTLSLFTLVILSGSIFCYYKRRG